MEGREEKGEVGREPRTDFVMREMEEAVNTN